MQELDDLIKISEFDGDGYKVTDESQYFKVALMNYSEKYRMENIKYLEKHNNSDEVFVILTGRCILFVADGIDRPNKIKAIPMEKGKVYFIKKGVWHTHVFFENTKVFIVENADTSDKNSQKQPLSLKHKRYIFDFFGFTANNN